MKISIVIPVYNSEKYIARCLDSILCQTYKDFEVICVNDGSKDNSLDILNEYKKKDKRVVVISKDNEGIAKTRNLGIKKASGKYLMFIDNDDYIEKDYLERYIKEVENNDYDLVIGGFQRITEDKKILDKRYVKDTKWGRFIVVAPWAKLYKRDFIVKNKIEFLDYGIGEDIYFYIQVLDKASSIKSIDYVGYNWFFNTKSVSNTDHVGINEKVDVLTLVEKVKSLKIKNIDKNIIDYFYTRLIIYYLLFSGKHANKKRFIKEYKKLKDYLSKEVPNFKKLLGSKMPKDEELKFKVILKMFNILDSLHLIGLFASIYCKGGK